jgi:hypothetical protein
MMNATCSAASFLKGPAHNQEFLDDFKLLWQCCGNVDTLLGDGTL